MPRAIAIIGAGLAVLAAGVWLAATSFEEMDTEAHVDGAFIVEMVPHQRVAEEVAELGAREAETDELRRLAMHSSLNHRARVEALEVAHWRLFGESVVQGEHGTVGLSLAEMGLEQDFESLPDADPFEPVWIEAMIALHQGAVAMAEIQLAEGHDDVVTELSESIVADGRHEIERLRTLRGRLDD